MYMIRCKEDIVKLRKGYNIMDCKEDNNEQSKIRRNAI